MMGAAVMGAACRAPPRLRWRHLDAGLDIKLGRGDAVVRSQLRDLPIEGGIFVEEIPDHGKILDDIEELCQTAVAVDSERRQVALIHDPACEYALAAPVMAQVVIEPIDQIL